MIKTLSWAAEGWRAHATRKHACFCIQHF